MTKLPPPLEDWERANLSAHFEFANELGRQGLLPADYGRAKKDDWHEPINGEVKFQ